ncbi:MAG TPA: LytTR family DNA-binding domain-containing protein [Candidatus Angelobacter sp.]|nr:LytTR family DNA-binding domain-containing protein [Candidatus Angelobacter sp.]
MAIRTVIVDDEPLARRRLLSFLNADSEIEIAGECGDGRTALDVISAQKPALLFLDIQMPEMDGFSVLQSLKLSPMPLVIFVTAFDHYAVKAFEAHALDYLLKPFSRQRFGDALLRAKDHLRQRQGAAYEGKLTEMMQQLAARRNSLPLRTRGRLVFVPMQEIDWLEADANYVRVHAGQETHIVREKIGDLEAKLDPQVFLRVHRSFIVNVDRIRELVPCDGSGYIVVLRGGKEVPCGRTYHPNLHRLLQRSEG